MKNTTHLLVIVLLTIASSLSASSITGKLMQADETPVYYANVILFSVGDSSIVDVQYSEEDGSFVFKDVTSGDYWIECTYVGLPDYVTEVFDLSDSDKDMGVFTFEAQSNNLDEVVVTARKPMLELKPDKIVLNVEGSINAAGSDAFTLLRKSPGVVIDNSDNIFMLGKGGVQIYIDGKPSPLNGSDLVEYLKTIPSSEIESIEIITQPSAKYEAEGNAGIINIKFRRDKNLGTSGNANISTAQGITSAYNGTVRLTNRTKKFNTYGSVSLYDGEGYNPMSLYRVQSGLIFDQEALGGGDWKGYNLRAGTDYYINEKHTVGLLYFGSSSDGNWTQDSETNILMDDGNFMVDSILLAQTRSDWERTNNNFNLNYKFDSGSGKTLNVDLDYGVYDNKREEDQPNTYILPVSKEVLNERNFANESPNNIKIATVKLDYSQEAWGGSFSTGIKLSRVLTDNTFNFYNVVDGNRDLDINRSNAFEYDEDVNAAYVNYAKAFGALNVNAGLRVEHTHSIGNLEAMVPTDNERVERDYVDLFPSLGLSYKMDDKNSFQLNYSRRLNRPSYNDLNPFRERLDELTFEQGNPFLSPEYANSVQLSHSWNYKLTTSISYSHTSDMIARITDAEEERFAFITWRNIADQYTYSLNMSAPLPIRPWWNSYTSVSGTRTHNKADFGEGKNIDLKVYTFNVYSQHNFNLPKGYMIELSGWYNSPSIWEGNFKMKAMYSLDFGIQKSFLDNTLNVRASISDIFRTQTWTGVTTLGNQFIEAAGSWDSRRVRLNLSYNFGNKNVKSRKRKTGLEDEQRRIKNDN